MAVRLKDIAHDLGVSTVTVSKVARGSLDVSDATRKRVLKRMAELNYRPNLVARGLASGRTYTMGLVVPDLVHPYFAEFAKALSGILRTNSRALVITSSEEDPEVEHEEIRNLLSRGVDVLMIASCQTNLRNFFELGVNRTPYLLFDRNFPNLIANFVGSDDVAIGEMATRHLLELGRRRIAHIGARNSSPSFDRLRGYQNVLVEAGLSTSDRLVIQRERVEETGDAMGAQMMKLLLKLKPRPDAVFCYNDLTAIGAIEAILEAGLSVPEDIAIIGCGNLRYANYLRVPLSSIDQGASELGRLAGGLALELSAMPDQEAQSIRVPPRLVARASTLGKVSPKKKELSVRL
ncbi:LacI family DNA-binding transcriptional regulator [Granulicella tundricola]|uniref:Transcriptional regulator, LacI family n=1 Tax=Granulicella tundricola (strain ATCC BAA-1859 / DSM 23138 / MP5ACTX9) TaxID=1198114 RepID=E8X5W5_GRATM|nr:LacI family DNA-binding transcriptional regulator [Granulicella tundricola]ADW70849.1 transcriptional regulator, LacI family [Granulicella tundricola MP5ACTX9]